MEQTMLLDFNNLAVSKLFSKNVMEKNGYEVKNISYPIWEQEILSAIYKFYLKYRKSNEIVLAIDHVKSWRKLYFNRYKEQRQQLKDKYNIDWKEYNRIFQNYIEEIKESLPLKVIQLKYAEGDDIIGTIVLNNPEKSHIIISSDKDYLQLCKGNIKLYSINKQEEMKHPNPEMFLQESSLIGQQKDNIFNVITPLDYPNKLRKPGFGKKKAEKFLIEGLEKSLNQNIEYKRKFINENGETVNYNSEINLKERYEFNRNLIDFRKIPESLKRSIIKKYKEYEYPNPEKIYEFFNKKQWPWFLDNFVQVENNLLQLYKSERI